MRPDRPPVGPGKSCVPKVALTVADPDAADPARDPLDPRNLRSVLAFVFHRPCCSASEKCVSVLMRLGM